MEGQVTGESSVTCDNNITIRQAPTVPITTRAMEKTAPQLRREALEFGHPVPKQRGRRHDQSKAEIRTLGPFEMMNRRNRLKRLPESHLIRQDRPTQAIQTIHDPRCSGRLIRPQASV